MGTAADILTDEDRIAYWKGAYDRMAARNIELDRKLTVAQAALKAVRAHRPDYGDTIWQQVEDAIAVAS